MAWLTKREKLLRLTEQSFYKEYSKIFNESDETIQNIANNKATRFYVDEKFDLHMVDYRAYSVLDKFKLDRLDDYDKKLLLRLFDVPVDKNEEALTIIIEQLQCLQDTLIHAGDGSLCSIVAYVCDKKNASQENASQENASQEKENTAIEYVKHIKRGKVVGMTLLWRKTTDKATHLIIDEQKQVQSVIQFPSFVVVDKKCYDLNYEQDDKELLYIVIGNYRIPENRPLFKIITHDQFWSHVIFSIANAILNDGQIVDTIKIIQNQLLSQFIKDEHEGVFVSEKMELSKEIFTRQVIDYFLKENKKTNITTKEYGQFVASIHNDIKQIINRINGEKFDVIERINLFIINGDFNDGDFEKSVSLEI